MTRFPTRISSGRQPIKDDFRGPAGRKEPFAPSPQKEERRKTRRVPGEEGRDELGGVTGGESRNNLGGVSTVESGEAVHSVQVEESEEDTSSTETTSGTTRRSGGPGGRTPELWHALGRAWPQQGRGYGRQDGGRTLRVLWTPPSSARNLPPHLILFYPNRDSEAASVPPGSRRSGSGALRCLNSIGGEADSEAGLHLRRELPDAPHRDAGSRADFAGRGLLGPPGPRQEAPPPPAHLGGSAADRCRVGDERGRVCETLRPARFGGGRGLGARCTGHQRPGVPGRRRRRRRPGRRRWRELRPWGRSPRGPGGVWLHVATGPTGRGP
ncbi:hypothetical protein NDU88_006128 [Pleurodeles waltl]|uniref:Uncharacterized protein n=1 Tax=Pleurodeles waltl TaxID=8319 RepID=A0AAV7SNV2_PLEWA|nr:hypothetical protein NDU88_006128 [Pleurodeles waltl]